MLLALANLMHHKVRSLLSALAVGIGVAMLVTLIGLTHGSLNEVMDRMRAVDADLLIAPRDFNSIIVGAPFSEKHAAKAESVRLDGRPVAARVAPVFLGRIVLSKVGGEGAERAKEMYNAFGMRAADWDFFLPSSGRLKGRSFSDRPGLERQLFDLLTRYGTLQTATTRIDPGPRDAVAGAFELVIDQRLADVAGVGVGDTVAGWGHRFKVVGIAPSGVTVRIFAPLATVRAINEQPGKATFLFVKLRPDVDAAAAQALLQQELGATVLTMSEYSNLLAKDLATIPDFTLALSAITLVVAFLFVLVIMYTVVIQRTREIGILKSLGASGGYVVLTVLAESMMLSLAGTAIGLGLSFAARTGILYFKPLLTVDLDARYLLVGAATGLIGGLLSGLYPAVVAARQDPVTALSYE